MLPRGLVAVSAKLLTCLYALCCFHVSVLGSPYDEIFLTDLFRVLVGKQIQMNI